MVDSNVVRHCCIVSAAITVFIAPKQTRHKAKRRLAPSSRSFVDDKQKDLFERTWKSFLKYFFPSHECEMLPSIFLSRFLFHLISSSLSPFI